MEFTTKKIQKLWKRSIFGDFDGDGVMNAFDCKPKNKRKQDSEDIGYQQDRVDYAEEEYKKGRKDESEFNKNAWINEKRVLKRLKGEQ